MEDVEEVLPQVMESDVPAPTTDAKCALNGTHKSRGALYMKSVLGVVPYISH